MALQIDELDEDRKAESVAYDEFLSQLVAKGDAPPAETPPSAPEAPSAPSVDVSDFIKYKTLLGDDQAALQKAREIRGERTKELGLAQAVGDFGAGLAGQKVDPGFYNTQREQAGMAVKGAEGDAERNRRVVQDYMNNKRAESVAKDNRDAREATLAENMAFRKQSHQDNMDLKRLATEDKRRREALPSEKQVSEITDFDQSISGVKSALNAMKPGFVGPVDGRVPELLIGGENSAFRAEVGRMVDAYRKLITGAGASNQELKKLESRLPQPTDTEERFKAKAENFVQNVERQKGVYLENLQRRGKDVHEFQAAPGTNPPPPLEVERKTTDGKIAIFDGNTKKFLRFKD